MIYTARQRAMIWLNMIVGLSAQKLARLEMVVSAENLILNPSKYADKLVDVIGKPYADKLRIPLEEKLINDIIYELNSKKIGVITIGDYEYPETLEYIDTPPYILYYKGDVSLLKSRCLGIVGTRNPSRYGVDCTKSFAETLSSAGITIVSGLARGIDGAAHKATLDAKGKTIGVLGCGIDVIYPAENATLYAMVAKEGLIISEYGLGVSASQYHFPERNRIISGISQGILVAEAGLKSGSLITANLALEQGREVFVIPSALNSPRGAGSNKLIRDMQGAIVLSPDDVAERLGIHGHKEVASVMQLDFTEEQVVSALTYSNLHFDDLLKITGLGVSDLNSLLTRMELMQIIKKLDNNQYGV